MSIHYSPSRNPRPKKKKKNIKCQEQDEEVRDHQNE